MLIDLLYLLAAVLASPFLAWKLATTRRFRSGLLERLGGTASPQQTTAAVLGLGVAASVLLPLGGFIFLGVAAAEGIYLTSMSKNPRFQRMVRSRRGR